MHRRAASTPPSFSVNAPQPFEALLDTLCNSSSPASLRITDTFLTLEHSQATSTPIPHAYLRKLRRPRMHALRLLLDEGRLRLVFVSSRHSIRALHARAASLATLLDRRISLLAHTTNKPRGEGPAIQATLLCMGGYAPVSNGTAVTEYGRRADAELVLIWEDLKRRRAVEAAKILEDALATVRQRGLQDLGGPLVFCDREGVWREWDGKRLEAVFPGETRDLVGAPREGAEVVYWGNPYAVGGVVKGVRGNYYSSAVPSAGVGLRLVGAPPSYGYANWDCVLRVLKAGGKGLAEEVLDGKTGVKQSFVATTKNVEEGMRRVWKEREREGSPSEGVREENLMSTRTFYLFDSRPLLAWRIDPPKDDGVFNLVPRLLGMSPEVCAILVVLIGATGFALGCFGYVAMAMLVTNFAIMASLFSYRIGDRVRVVNKHLSFTDVFNIQSLRSVLFSLLLLPVLAFLQLLEAWTIDKKHNGWAFAICLYLPSMFTAGQLVMNANNYEVARPSDEETKCAVADTLTLLVRHKSFTRSTAFLGQLHLVGGHSKYVHASHVPEDLMERWSHGFWFNRLTGAMSRTDSELTDPVSSSDTTKSEIEEETRSIDVRRLELSSWVRGRCSPSCAGCLTICARQDEEEDFCLA